jgi:hypothetical protein
MESAGLKHNNAIQDLLGRAQRRVLMQALADRSALAACASLGAFLAMLLLGTQVLRWYWPVLLLAVTAGWGVWKAFAAVPGEYKAAQRLDARCGLKDLLSTAWHFRQHRDAARNPALVDAVHASGEEAAGGVDLEAAFPWRMNMRLWSALAMLVAVLGAFGVRYGVLRTFDLRPSLLAVNIDPLTGVPQPTDDGRVKKKGGTEELAGMNLPEGDRAAIQENEKAIEEMLRTMEVQDPNQVAAPGEGKQGRKGESSQQQEGENSEGGDRGDDGLPPSIAGDDPKKGGDEKQQGKKSDEKNTLLDKMKDALANLMDKMKIDQKGGDQAGDKAGSQKGEGQQQANNKKGMPNQGKQAQGEQSDQEASQEGQPSDAQQAQMAKGSQMQEPPSDQQKSGAGKSDGKKDTELAEQLEAMGKLSELLTKRSNEVKGEMMVEVTNTRNQQARTPYTGKQGAHKDTGGEINRDEVPLHLQHYVQKYYESVRRQAPATTPTAPPSGAKQ